MDQKHDENVYAIRARDQQTIHISQVPRNETGRGSGYFCLGCKRQLQAVLSDIEKRKKFFRHDAKAVKGQSKCTYSDETYRHKLAKEILQRLKQVKVPKLYKYSFDQNNQTKYLIQESHFCEASKILIENYLYEDRNGNINFSREIDNKNGNELFIKPDVIFLDRNNKPILVIELVATHKPNKEKLIKLKRLGIDAIQIRIPKDSPESIENVFYQTNNTVWIYNAKEESYTLPVSGTHSEGISEFDGIQIGFFEENFICRQAQIRNLIRRIGQLLETEHYRNTVENIRSEIQRVERNTESNRQRLESLRSKYRERGIKKHSTRRAKLESEKTEFQYYNQGLENRYHSKRRDLEREENSLEYDIEEIEHQTKEFDSRGSSTLQSINEEERAILEIRGKIEDLPRIFSSNRRSLEYQIKQVERDTDQESESEATIRSNIERAADLLGSKEKELERDIEAEGRTLLSETQRIEGEIRNIESEERTIETTINEEYPRNRDEYTRRVEEGSFKRSQWFNSQYAKLRELTNTIRVFASLEKELGLLEEKNRK